MQFYQDTQRNLLIYPTQSDLLLRHIPEARLVNGNHIALPHSFRNLQVLRWLNFPTPAIITDANYDWPHAPGIKPYETQKLAANFMVLNRRCFNLSDMGVGKTLSALWAADWLMRQHKEDFRALIVAPLSTLQTVWGAAIFQNFLQNRTYQILHGSAQAREKALNTPADFYIINFDGICVGASARGGINLGGLSELLASRTDIKLAIVDEASAYKDAQTKRHKISRKVIGTREYLWLMTGTPTPNDPVDAYGLAKLVNNAHGKSEATFKRETMYQVSQFIWKPQKDGYEKARALLQPAIRIPIEAVWDAPPMTTQQREVPLTSEQMTLMNELRRDLQVRIRNKEPIAAVNEAALRIKFLQIAMGAVYDADHKAHVIDAKPRFSELIELIEQAPGKVLVFIPLTSVLGLVYKATSRWSREVVNGDTSQKDRARIFQDFQQRPDPRILLADPGTAAHGVQLSMAQTVCWFGPTDKSELYAQANKRAHRPGQKYPVSVVQIVATKLEKEIFRRLENNLTMQGALLDLVASGNL